MATLINASEGPVIIFVNFLGKFFEALENPEIIFAKKKSFSDKTLRNDYMSA